MLVLHRDDEVGEDDRVLLFLCVMTCDPSVAGLSDVLVSYKLSLLWFVLVKNLEASRTCMIAACR